MTVTGWLNRQGPRIDWLIRVLGLAGFAVLVFLYQDFRGFVNCQAAYNDNLNERTRIVSDAAEQERTSQRTADDATRALFTDPSLAKPAGERSPGEVARLGELFVAYQRALTQLAVERAEADLARAANPLPPPPSVTCR